MQRGRKKENTFPERAPNAPDLMQRAHDDWRARETLLEIVTTARVANIGVDRALDKHHRCINFSRSTSKVSSAHVSDGQDAQATGEASGATLRRYTAQAATNTCADIHCTYDARGARTERARCTNATSTKKNHSRTCQGTRYREMPWLMATRARRPTST